MKRKCKKHQFKLINISKFKLKHKFFAFFVIIIFLIVLYAKFLAVPIIVENTKTQMKTFATKSINYAVAETMNQNIGYGDLIKIMKET